MTVIVFEDEEPLDVQDADGAGVLVIRDGGSGPAGPSAYEVAVSNGFVGTQSQWLDSLNGADGAPGADGPSAYAVAVEQGFVGTEAQWLASLTGATGDPGAPGDPGPANTLTAGTVTTGAPGSAASATVTGTAPNQTLNLTIPRGDVGAQGIPGADGDPGPANTLTVGTVTTGTPGSPASATITGAAPNQTLDLAIPAGADGTDGAPGSDGTNGTNANVQMVVVVNPATDTRPAFDHVIWLGGATQPANMVNGDLWVKDA